MSRAHLAAAVFGAVFGVALPAWSQEVWSFDGAQGALGTSQIFSSVPGGLLTTASGFTDAGSAVNLFQKNAGPDEVGLGLTNDPSGRNEITQGSFVQLSLNDLSPSQLFSLSVGTGSSSLDPAGNPEVWGIGLSNTSGQRGATVLTGTGNQVVHLSASDSSFVDITNTTGGFGNGVLVSEMDATGMIPPMNPLPPGIPEPPTFAVLCSALLGFAAMVRRRRKG